MLFTGTFEVYDR